MPPVDADQPFHSRKCARRPINHWRNQLIYSPRYLGWGCFATSADTSGKTGVMGQEVVDEAPHQQREIHHELVWRVACQLLQRAPAPHESLGEAAAKIFFHLAINQVYQSLFEERCHPGS